MKKEDLIYNTRQIVTDMDIILDNIEQECVDNKQYWVGKLIDKEEVLKELISRIIINF